MKPFVFLQKILGGEGLFAHLTLPELVVMNFDVLVQVRLPFESLVTNHAFVNVLAWLAQIGACNCTFWYPVSNAWKFLPITTIS